ncbi:3-hydroxyisobutyryl-CoA hydrolase, mitochondrial isoform X2 [Athalia rosae]|nr:3-hydroxyisobutyryl-CoA hydrolase, mitochondrial isoform X2 [Athalia rosae]
MDKVPQANSVDETDVLIENVKDAGIITLNRPKPLNALNLSMIRKIYPTLKGWEGSKRLVIIKATGQKAFCAGGDVKSVTTALDLPDGKKLGQTFFREEYTLNHLIGTYKSPYLALLNGVTMGGGVGLSVHGKYRIATENTLFAMPETAIGLVPDVGGTFFLPRLKGKLGYYLGLTGHRLKGTDVLLAGIATHYVLSERLGDLTNELLETNSSDIDVIIKKYQPNNFSPEFTLNPYLEQIDHCFTASSIQEIIQKLESDGSDWAVKSLQLLKKMSPTALAVTFAALNKGAQQSLAECLKMEFRLTSAALTKDGDFYEGVRALLVDKDQNPVWKPATINEISPKDIMAKFAKLPATEELDL